MIYNCLEQFHIYLPILIPLEGFDFSFINGALIISIGLISFLIVLQKVLQEQKDDEKLKEDEEELKEDEKLKEDEDFKTYLVLVAWFALIKAYIVTLTRRN